MKQSLQLKFSQQLTMTPQLQQAIKLLQLSTLELQQEIQTALENNPLLELDETFDEIAIQSNDNQDPMDSSEALEQQNIAEELPLDTQWDDYYSSGTNFPSSQVHNDYSEFPIYQEESPETLKDYLMWQANLSHFSETDFIIATAIIASIDDKGYLNTTTDEIYQSLKQSGLELEPKNVDIVLKRIQHFDPIGVGARTIQECLLLQLNQLAEDTSWLNEARIVLEKHLSLLGNHDFRTLTKVTHLKEDDLKHIIQLIQKLDPHPGLSFKPNNTDYIIPDVIVSKRQGVWGVELNNDAIPHIKINQRYAALSHSGNSSDSQYIRQNLNEAKWLIKSLESRNETLLKVASCIVEQQQLFFERGEEFMKPLILSDIATSVEMHESTISRVTTQKYLYSPKGIFELKYFFSSHVNTEAGGEASSTAIRALIKKLISAEDPKKPLSDSKIVELLAKQGIIVARRTIAKYREALMIPPSNQRKKLI